MSFFQRYKERALEISESLKLSRRKLVVNFAVIRMFLTSSSAQHGANHVHYVKEKIILLRNVTSLVKFVLYKNLIV